MLQSLWALGLRSAPVRSSYFETITEETVKKWVMAKIQVGAALRSAHLHLKENQRDELSVTVSCNSLIYKNMSWTHPETVLS